MSPSPPLLFFVLPIEAAKTNNKSIAQPKEDGVVSFGDAMRERKSKNNCHTKYGRKKEKKETSSWLVS